MNLARRGMHRMPAVVKPLDEHMGIDIGRSPGRKGFQCTASTELEGGGERFQVCRVGQLP
jgi:hypothetical protein